MRILHTSDWHIGRTFHGHSILPALHDVLTALVEIVRVQNVEVVVVAGDVFDSATPSGDAFEVLTGAIRDIRSAGAHVIITSGNHDSATRLGFQAEFAALAGVHVVTRPEKLADPVTIDDAHGPVHFYGIPYLAPALIRHLVPEAPPRTQAEAMHWAMQRVRADIDERGGRSVALAHCFAAGAHASEGVEREVRVLAAGSLDNVPIDEFEGPDYVALGHIHGRSILSSRVRYSGAPMHYSFSEASKPRGVWLVDLDDSGLQQVEWVDLPIPRPLSVLTGTLDELLNDQGLAGAEEHWVNAVLTDRTRPLDAMRRLQARYPYCANLDFRPTITADDEGSSYTERMRASRSDSEIVASFLTHVRNGDGMSDAETEIIDDAITAHETAEMTS